MENKEDTTTENLQQKIEQSLNLDEPKIEDEIDKKEIAKFLVQKLLSDLHEAHKLSEKEPEDESQPFIYKYKAREIIQELLKNKNISQQIQEKENSLILKLVQGLLKFRLGINYQDCEEYHDAEQCLMSSLEIYQSLPDQVQRNFINAIQDLYNHIGINHCNRGSHEKGIPYLEKAMEIYNENIKNDSTTFTIQVHLNSFDNQLLAEAQDLAQSDLDTLSFLSGGYDPIKLEKNYTLTLFYLAQVYTKNGQTEKGVQFCADTMKRQLSFKEFEIKDFVVNCINIAEYFIKNAYFAQGEYCLYSGMALLPQDLQKKKKLRATLQMQLGRYYLERLVFGVNALRESRTVIPEVVQKKFVEFPELNVKFPEVSDLKGLEDAKLLFKLANTQFRKSLEFFVLDGFVTEHIQMKQDLSKLYKYLSMLDPDFNRVYAMQERRRDLLEPVIAQINPKAYEATVIELQVELNDILSTMFDLKFEHSGINQGAKPKKSEYEEMNSVGFKCAEYTSECLKTLYEKEEKHDYAQAILNLTLSVARIYSKLYSTKKETQIQYLEKAFREYEKLQKYMIGFMKEKQIERIQDLPDGMRESYSMMMEMLELLPIKLSKLNAALHK